MKSCAQSGNVLVIILVAIALFAAISFAFTQGSRGNVSFVQDEMAKASSIDQQNCTHAISAANKRLTLRSCTSISMESDAALIADASCAIFHAHGGGVKADCAPPPPPPSDPCKTGAMGAVCGDGAIYIGDISGNRIYAASANDGAAQWSTENVVTGATSTTDGLANSNNATIVSKGASVYPLIWVCKNKAPAGTWYLPSRDELNLIWTNQAAANLTGFTSFQGTSTENSNMFVWYQMFSNGTQTISTKTGNHGIRCVRR